MAGFIVCPSVSAPWFYNPADPRNGMTMKHLDVVLSLDRFSIPSPSKIDAREMKVSQTAEQWLAAERAGCISPWY